MKKTSQIFSEFVHGNVSSSTIKEAENLRDRFFEKHDTIAGKNAKEFIFKCLDGSHIEKFKQEKGINALGISIFCGLFSLRDKELVTVFLKKITSSPILNNIEIYLADCARKGAENFSKTSLENAFHIMNVLNETKNFTLLESYAPPLISLMESGYVSKKNNYYFEKFMRLNMNIWANVKFPPSFLFLKCLRFYQDLVSIGSANQNDQLIVETKKLCLKYADTVLQLFKILIEKGHISRNITEVCRILFDPKTYNKMKKEFPKIYSLFNSNLQSYQQCFTNSLLPQVFLPYSKYRLLSNILDPSKSKGIIEDLLSLNISLSDPDLILADIVRTIILISDFLKSESNRCNALKRIIFKSHKKGINLKSTIFALTIDFFFTLQQSNDFTQRMKTLISPVVSIFFDARMEEISTRILEQMLDEFTFPFPPNKLKSLCDNLNFAKVHINENLFLAVQHLSISNVQMKQKLMELLGIKQNQEIPPELISFHNSDISLSSPEGIKMLNTISFHLNDILKSNGENWKNAMPSILKFLNSVLPNKRKNFEIIFSHLDLRAIIPYMSQNELDAMTILKWVSQNCQYSVFNEAIDYTNIRDFYEPFSKLISNDISQRDNYCNLLLNCPSLGASPFVIQSICESFPTSKIITLSNIFSSNTDYINIIGFIFKSCKDWSDDSQTKLITLLSGFLLTPSDFHKISTNFINEFDHLPFIVIDFFKNCLQTRMHREFALFIEKIEQSKNRGAIEFCKEIRHKWSLIKHPLPKEDNDLLFDSMVI